MSSVVSFARRYPTLAVAVAVGVVGLGLELAGHGLWAQWLISGFALVIAGIQAIGMVRALLHGRAGVDILAVAAILATVIVGEYWASMVIVLMLSGGEALEDFAAQRAKRELSALLSRAPQTAHLLDDGRIAVDIPIGEVKVGDLLAVRPGEVAPVDGVLESESATMDQSSLTGESLPVEHERGAEILSGSVNGASAVAIRATALAAESQYQRIVQMVEAAAESRAPVVRLADRYAVPFTLVAFALAGLAWAISGEPVRFAEVLVVATPCPLLIAAPVAFIAGMSRAAKNGIIVKGGGTLEQLSSAKTIAFDKTGTLTHGAPEVLAVRPTAGHTTEGLLALVASAEQHSGHVLARSIVDLAAHRAIALRPASDVEEITGFGVVATVDGAVVAVGKPAFLHSRGIPLPERTLHSGHIAVCVAVDGAYVGEVVLGDRIRENARSTLARLRELGLQDTIMLTGDSAATAAHIAAEVGIAHVKADCLPLDKVHAVQEVTNRPIIMVGDGVNDAPVLSAADVGIALGAKGATAASESADVVIMLDDLSRTARAVSIGQYTMRVALQSIWLGIALSVALMIVAVFGFLPAIVGAGMQEFVDLATILNALRALGGRQDDAQRAVEGQSDAGQVEAPVGAVGVHVGG